MSEDGLVEVEEGQVDEDVPDIVPRSSPDKSHHANGLNGDLKASPSADKEGKSAQRGKSREGKSHSRERTDKDKGRHRDRDKEKDRHKERHKDSDRSRDKDRDRHKDRTTGRHRDRDRQKGRDRDAEHAHKDSSQRPDRDRSTRRESPESGRKRRREPEEREGSREQRNVGDRHQQSSSKRAATESRAEQPARYERDATTQRARHAEQPDRDAQPSRAHAAQHNSPGAAPPPRTSPADNGMESAHAAEHACNSAEATAAANAVPGTDGTKPLSLEEMLKQKKAAEEEAAKPKFMSRKEREAAALERCASCTTSWRIAPRFGLMQPPARAGSERTWSGCLLAAHQVPECMPALPSTLSLAT